MQLEPDEPVPMGDRETIAAETDVVQPAEKEEMSTAVVSKKKIRKFQRRNSFYSQKAGRLFEEDSQCSHRWMGIGGHLAFCQQGCKSQGSFSNADASI